MIVPPKIPACHRNARPGSISLTVHTVAGMRDDGWLEAGEPATIRMFASARDLGRCANLTVSAPPGFKGRAPYSITGGGRHLRDALRDQEARVVILPLPDAGRPYTDLRIAATRAVPYADGTKVALHLDTLSIGSCARPAVQVGVRRLLP